MIHDDADECYSSPARFRRRFQHGNLPCLFSADLLQPNFQNARSKWVVKKSSTDIQQQQQQQQQQREDVVRINHKWFQTTLGEHAPVPVRYQPPTNDNDKDNNHQNGDKKNDKDWRHGDNDHLLLDDHGRAMECETREMPLSKWLQLLSQQQQRKGVDDAESNSSDTNDDDDHCRSSNASCYYYLKDWHLVSWLSSKNNVNDNNVQRNNKTSKEEDPLSLYCVPEHFQNDLLNNFLTRFTTDGGGGDYRFVYWGPAGSRTTLHSDVLNSFSWSFNIHGTKEWTFFLPPSPSKREDYVVLPDKIVVIQRAGDCIFVPSGWRHQVVNLEETLSINHNWITTANLDLCWDCLALEIEQIEAELAAWDISAWDAKESMLRGCAGLDVTAFFFMILVDLLEKTVLEGRDDLHEQEEEQLEQRQKDSTVDQDWEYQFDLVRLRDMLLELLQNKSLHLQERLAATLNCEESAAVALEIARQVLQFFSL